VTLNLRGIEPYTEADALAFEDYLIHSNNRCVLTSIRRQQIRLILRNPAISYSVGGHRLSRDSEAVAMWEDQQVGSQVGQRV
jgi:hypothetical protein